MESGDDLGCTYQATFVSGGERSVSCRDVSRSTRTMGPPQIGQLHSGSGSGEAVGLTEGADAGALASNCWQSGSSLPRRLARKPKWRIRTKPVGRT